MTGRRAIIPPFLLEKVLRALGQGVPVLKREVQCRYDVDVLDLRFEWDPRKDIENRRLHGVSFGEAETVFLDEFAVLIDDPDPSDDEDRFVILGVSSRSRLLSVAHCFRASAAVIRIISARKASRREREQYDGRWTR